MNIDEVIANKKNCLYYGNRLLLPFNAHFMKVIIDDDIITDFSSKSKDLEIIEQAGFTEIYFKQYKDLRECVSKYEAIKLIAVNKDDDIFDFNNHKKISLYLKENHNVSLNSMRMIFYLSNKFRLR